MGGKMTPEYHAKYYQEHKSQFKVYRKRFKDSVHGKDCERKYRVKFFYTLTREQHLARLESQAYMCAMPGCRTSVNLSSDIDHDHSCCPGPKSCGKCIRGILCHQHNNGLSFFEDRPELLLGAFKYLQGELNDCFRNS